MTNNEVWFTALTAVLETVKWNKMMTAVLGTVKWNKMMMVIMFVSTSRVVRLYFCCQVVGPLM